MKTKRLALLWYRLPLWGTIMLLCQSVALLSFRDDSSLKINLLLQVTALCLFALFAKKVSGTYLNAPLVFAVSIFMWHSTFLLGHYFELSPIFELDFGAFSVGFEHIYKATALVGFSIALALVGMLRAYRHECIRVRCIAPQPHGPAQMSKRVAWWCFAVMASILMMFLFTEGPQVFGGRYIGLYVEPPSSLYAVLFFRTELFWVVVIVLMMAAYRSDRRARILLSLAVIGLAAVLAMLGPRTTPFVCLVALLISWDNFVSRVKLRLVMAFVLFISAASFVVSAGRALGLGAQVFDVAGPGAVDLLSLFHEQGRSIEVVLRTMDLTQSTGLMYGRTFADAAVSIIPLPVLDLMGYKFENSLANQLVDNAPDLGPDEGFGSSLIAELYYNFGMVGCLAFLAIGWFISRAYFRYRFSGNIFLGLKVMTVAIMYTVMMRYDAGSCWRLLVYAFIVVAIMEKNHTNYAQLCSRKTQNLLPPPSAQQS